MMSDHLLTIDHLNIEFDTGQGVVHAVRDVSLHVDKGEILGIVGESGSGKSVTMMSCLGLLADNERVVGGEVRLDGMDLSCTGLKTRKDEKAHETFLNTIRGKEAAMIFQDPMTYLNPVLTIGTQLTEGIVEHCRCSKKEAWERGAELLKKVGISNPEKRMRQYPYQFSGGMRQRIMIAIALSCRPKLLIADEPTTALDVTVQAQILELIETRAREEGMSVIMITHDLGVVASLCQRIVIMYGGRIVEEGTTDQIFYEAKHPYTRGLLSSVARQSARAVGETGGRSPLVSIPGAPPDLVHINRGCPFLSRCPEAMKICRDYVPAVTEFEPEHSCSCWLYCREQAAVLVEKQDRMRGESHG